jgi:hypothetical protein
MQGFRGYGYDDAFVNHLHNVIERLKAEPNTLVQAVSECDEICGGCPHQVGSQCRKSADSDYRIKNMDTCILEQTGIKPNEIVEISRMIERVNNTFKTRAQIADICGDCLWMEKCAWYLDISTTRQL